MQGQLLGSWHPHDPVHGCAWLGSVTSNKKQVQTFFISPSGRVEKNQFKKKKPTWFSSKQPIFLFLWKKKQDFVLFLTLWELGYDTFLLWFQFRPKTSSCQLPYQCHSSSADCIRELFKGSNKSDSLLDCTQRKFFGWGLWIFCEWHHKWSSFWAILSHIAWSRAQPLGQSISLKFSSRLESESFEPLIDFLAFLVLTLNKQIK